MGVRSYGVRELGVRTVVLEMGRSTWIMLARGGTGYSPSDQIYCPAQR